MTEITVVNAADDEYVAQSYGVAPFATASESPGFERQKTFGKRLHCYGIKDAIQEHERGPRFRQSAKCLGSAARRHERQRLLPRERAGATVISWRV